MKNLVEKSLFEVLFEKEICFAVNVSLNSSKNKSIDENSRDYFLIILKTDLKNIKKEFSKLKNEAIQEFGEKECKNLYSILDNSNLKFSKNNDYEHILEYDLSTNEIAEFKTYMDKFVKVQHNKYGRVYELKNNSFKKLHENIKLAAVKNRRMNWIEYNKQKPEIGQLVLAYRDVESKPIYSTVWSDDDERFAYWNKITHWMPLQYPSV